MIDPPREEVKEAVKVCRQAGIRAVMITGDHRDTAAAIARELGIIKDDSEAIAGSELDKMSDEELERMGLTAPQVTRLMKTLCGVNVCTVSQAKEYIMGVLRRA
jgi:magnesium-transporting ATPase (P-type)